MRSFVILIFAFCIHISAGFSQKGYPCDSIPGFLRIGAAAVVRSWQEKYTIINEKKAFIDVKIAITLLNENAKEQVYISLPYDKLFHISRIKANAFNEDGKLVWVLNKNEIYDIKESEGPEYLDDSRDKIFMFPSYNYPFTIEYAYRYTTEDLLINPVTNFHCGPGISVEKSGVQYVIPKSVPFRYKAVNLKSPTDSLWIRNKLYLSWQEENIPVKRQKVYAPEISKTMPTLYFTTERFNLGAYAGDLSSWNDYGVWVNKLNEDRDRLDKEQADQVKDLVKNAANLREKIRILYEYMQSKTRYFSVAFGIGGYQPVQAEQVAKNGYGDCKALSNYMKALLKEAGIESFYALVSAGPDKDINPSFPSNQFNHAILCVPVNNDTIWLECTSQTIPFGYLGSFTDDRHVLVITPEGGKLQRTPAYNKNENIINTQTEITLYGSGDADAKIRIFQSGIPYEALKAVSEEKEDDRREFVAHLLDYATFNLRKEEYSFHKTRVPVGQAKYDIHIRDLASKGGDRLFVNPSLLSKFHYTWKDSTEIELKRAYQRNDTVRITKPLDYKTEYLPGDLQVNTRFGKYTSHVSDDDKFIYFTRNLELNKAVYPKEDYPEFYDFIEKIAIGDHQTVILKYAKN
jgi:transglutaminase-like putative cysteine protease